MEIKDIFYKFEEIGCCTFSTINGNYPESRIAHFIAFDEKGLYFMTMNCKPFYHQLKKSKKVSVLGLNAKPKVNMTETKELVFDPGFFIRISGEVKEVSIEEIRAKNNPLFSYGLEDVNRYPNMVFFVIHRFRGEFFDYDFDKINRDHKLERERFSFGGLSYRNAGFQITDTCISCGRCEDACTFDAIIPKENGKRKILGNRCDECGNCINVCPVHAICHKIN